MLSRDVGGLRMDLKGKCLSAVLVVSFRGGEAALVGLCC